HHQLLGVRTRHVAFERPFQILHSLPIHDQEGVRIPFRAPRIYRGGRRSQRFHGQSGAAQTNRRASGNQEYELSSVARSGTTLALDLAAPVHFAAIDAGSNALRLVIARAASPGSIGELEAERTEVRLGHNAFTRHRLDEETIALASRAFRHFRRRMDRYDVQRYRAVATAATREARNRRELIDRIRRKSGIELEVISGAEEARLVRKAV